MQVKTGQLLGHPRMVQDFINGDALIGWDEDTLNEVFHFLAEVFGLGDCIGMVVLLNVYFMVLTFSMICLSFSPSKGGAAVTRMYSMTPADQISHL